MNMKIIKFIVSGILTFWSFGVFFSPVFAINMDSSRYKIQFGNVNIGANNESSSSYKLSTTLGQSAAGQFTSGGYIVKAGFQYINSIIPFTFTISSTNVNFGTLFPNTFQSATTNLSVSFGSAGSYQVTALEETSLKTMSNDIISDTKCNDGSQSCDINSANLWNSSSAYGLGYMMTGTDIPQTYINCQSLNGNYCFRPFPNHTMGEDPVVVMSNSDVTQIYDPDPNVRNKHSATVTFKANIPPMQAVGTYQNVINFVATPGY